jgi:hypothetical protein
MGRKRGVNKTTFDVVSINIPVTRRKSIMIVISTKGEEDIPIIFAASIWGMPSIVRRRPKVVAPPRINIDRQERSPASTNAPKRFSKDS